MPSETTIAIGLGILVHFATVIAFAVRLDSRARSTDRRVDTSEQTLKTLSDRVEIIAGSFAAFREVTAQTYTNAEELAAVETRLTNTINRLGDRMDRFIESKL